MKITQNGKIGRLPKALQEQLNCRMEKGQRILYDEKAELRGGRTKI